MGAASDSAGVGTALAIVCCAGMSTAIGAAVVSVPAISRLANHRMLAASLGASAGVMLYLSFVEMFALAHLNFLAAGHGKNGSYFYTTMGFFSGVLLMVILNSVVSALTGGHKHGESGRRNENCDNEDDDDYDDRSNSQSHHSLLDDAVHVDVCPCNGSASDLNNLMDMAEEMMEFERAHPNRKWTGRKRHQSGGISLPEQSRPLSLDAEDDDHVNRTEEESVVSQSCSTLSSHPNKLNLLEQRRLYVSGMNTFLAIFIHNFPEGLATFVASLQDPGVGAVLAVAIIIHNIPEGICVAMPIYYATGNRFNAFCWGVVSGLSEIIAALLAWAILAPLVSETVYGVMYSIVAGMMVIISISELLPPALRYDPENAVTGKSFIMGMAIMALSLVLLTSSAS